MFRQVFANLTEEESHAVYEILAQAVDNEESRDDVEDPYAENVHLRPASRVVERLNAALALLAEGGAPAGTRHCEKCRVAWPVLWDDVQSRYVCQICHGSPEDPFFTRAGLK